MSGVGAILRRELELAFRSPVAWVAMVAFHGFNGFAWRDLVSVWQESARSAASVGSAEKACRPANPLVCAISSGEMATEPSTGI